MAQERQMVGRARIARGLAVPSAAGIQNREKKFESDPRRRWIELGKTNLLFILLVLDVVLATPTPQPGAREV